MFSPLPNPPLPPGTNGERLAPAEHGKDGPPVWGDSPDQKTAPGAGSEPGLHDEDLEPLARALERLSDFFAGRDEPTILDLGSEACRRLLDLGAEACRRLKECREQRAIAEADTEALQKALAQAMSEVASLKSQRDAYADALDPMRRGLEAIRAVTTAMARTSSLRALSDVVVILCDDALEGGE